MSKEKNVIQYYVLCNRLKDVIRTGWKDWNVKRERLESVAEHIYGTQMLAIAMQSEYHYDIDIAKVMMMLAVHELEEIYIGDLTFFQITKEEKMQRGHEAVSKVLNSLINKEKIMELILEFDEGKTKEAVFAKECDKLECDIQCKLYDEEGCVDLTHQDDNKVKDDKEVKKLLKEYETWSAMWIKFHQDKEKYDENFLSVSNYVFENKIKSDS